MRILFRLCLTTIVVLMAQLCYAQSRATLVGTVTAADTEAPIAYALVHFPEAGVQSVTNGTGEFEVRLLPGEHRIDISFLGYEPVEQTIVIREGENRLSFVLQVANFHVEDVVVTATASKAGAATSSTISRTAMDHIQSSSLADVMSLLPGASTPDTRTLNLSQASSFSIRGGASLGAAIIMANRNIN